MEKKSYEITIHLLEKRWIKKVTIASEKVRLELWFRNFGNVSLDDRKTRDVFAGLMQGLQGVYEGEIPDMYATIEKGKGGKQRVVIGTTAEFLALLDEAFES